MTNPTDPVRDDAQPNTTAPVEAQTEIPMADDKPAAPVRATSTPPVVVDPWLARLDRVVDLVAIAALTLLCLRHQLGGEITAGAIVAVAGVQTGLRQISAARGAPAVGAIGALLLAVGVGAATHAPAVADAAHTLGQRGAVRGHLLLALGGAAGVALCALHPLATLAVLALLVILYVVTLPRRPRAAERGFARPGLLALLVLPLLVGLAACPPRPTPEPGPSQPVSGWTSTARAVLSTLHWALPAARVVTDSLLSDPPRTQVARALDATADAAGRLDLALDAYEHRGGDRCVANAAAGGVVVALAQLADTLADNGIALGVVLGRVVDGAASIVDALVPACASDAGWTSAGDTANARLRLTEDVARRRGIALRRDLDAIAEPR